MMEILRHLQEKHLLYTLFTLRNSWHFGLDLIYRAGFSKSFLSVFVQEIYCNVCGLLKRYIWNLVMSLNHLFLLYLQHLADPRTRTKTNNIRGNF